MPSHTAAPPRSLPPGSPRGPRSRTARFGRAALTVLAYGVLVGLTLEAAARIDDYLNEGASPWSAYSINTVFEPSPFGRAGKPGARFGKWQINAEGFRGPEPVPGRINVLTYGASETFGLYESPGHEYPRQLEALLNTAGERYNVINLGLPGLRIGRVEYLADAIRRVGARYVVVYPSPANYIGTDAPFCGQPSQPVPTVLTFADKVRVVGKIDRLIKRFLPSMAMDRLRDLSLQVQARGQTFMATVPPVSLAAFRDDLQCVVDTIRRQGAEPVLVTHATWFRGQSAKDSQAMLSSWRRAYPELLEPGFLDLERRANQAVFSVAEQAGVPLVDAAGLIPGGSDNFADFVHFTDAGASRMAALLSESIEARERTARQEPAPR